MADSLMQYVSPFTRMHWGEMAKLWTKDRKPADHATLRSYHALERRVVDLAARRGVAILAGTDTPNPYVLQGFSLHDELALLVESGLTPHQALRAATWAAADFLAATDSLGTVEQGKLADLVLLEANPLEDITNTTRIEAVAVGGRWLERPELDRMLRDAAARLGAVASN